MDYITSGNRDQIEIYNLEDPCLTVFEQAGN